MRLFRTARLAALVTLAALAAGVASASPSTPKNGVEYQTLPSAMPVPSGKKVEVIEFFMYHCPACNALDPALAEWVKKQGDAIQFRRIHVPRTGAADPEAHLFLALEAMQLDETLHTKVLQTWHVDRQRLKDDADNLAWALKNGLDKTKFLDAYNSFGVTTRLRNLDKVVNNYGVDSTPTLVINGRYVTSPSMIAEKNPELTRTTLDAATFQVVDALVQKAQQEQPATR